MSIELRHVSKHFGTFRALDDVSLTVRAGELLALLGPSGSGKTTLLRIIAGLDQANPDPRTLIRFHDQDVAATPVRRRRVGFVFQHYSLFRHMTVFENVAFGLKVQPRRIRPSAEAIAARVEALLRMVQLDGMAGRYPHQLSGGQRQRVALVRALAVEPRVLLLDEPFGALDARVRKELRSWLRRLHDEIHVTSVFVTHDQDEALEVADRIVVMNAGRIEQIGTPEEVFHHPQTPFVMRFLGETNAFHGRLQGNAVLLGDLAVPCTNPLPGMNGSAEVFVRPHDLVVDTGTDGPGGIPATVLRVQAAGPLVRIDLRTDDGHALAAQISQDRFATLLLQPGQTVRVRPRRVLAVSAS